MHLTFALGLGGVLGSGLIALATLLPSVTTVPPHGLGGKKHPPLAADLVTPAGYKAVLATPSANPNLLRIRAEMGGKFHSAVLGAAGVTPKSGPRLRPSVVDWRDRWGTNWITRPTDQGNSENCWAFASNGLIEAMVRIEHGVWCQRSVVELRKGVHKKTSDSGNPHEALTWAYEHGIADVDCSPFTTDDLPLKSSPDRAGRTVRLPKHVRIPNEPQQEPAKKWLDTVGPLVAHMDAYTDFSSSTTSAGKVYRRSKNATLRGGHLILVIGYDDNRRCWICKNSWGESWGDHGFFRIAYGECGIDSDEKYGLRGTNPDPWTKHRLHAGSMIESGNGALHRNFEMVAKQGSQVRHWWRQGGETGDFGWNAGVAFGNDVAASAAGPTLIASTDNRNFEAVYRTVGGRLHHWTFDQAAKKWLDRGLFGPADAAGVPAIIQGDTAAPGAFEVLVRTRDGKVSHWQRTVKSPSTWKEVTRFGAKVAHSGPALVQPVGDPKSRGHLFLVAVLDSKQMQTWERSNANGPWKVGSTFGTDVASPPCMIESQYSARDEKTPGDRQLCVAVNGKVEHWMRKSQGDTWQRSAVFGSNIKAVNTLIEGSFGFNLEVVVQRSDDRLQHYWRDGSGWHVGKVIGLP